LIKYIKSVLWRVAKRLSCIENDRCPKVKASLLTGATQIRRSGGSLPFELWLVKTSTFTETEVGARAGTHVLVLLTRLRSSPLHRTEYRSTHNNF